LDFNPSIFRWMRPSDLLDVLIDRVNEGRGLDYLAITSTAGICARDVQLLREVVADVSWDGFESNKGYLTRYNAEEEEEEEDDDDDEDDEDDDDDDDDDEDDEDDDEDDDDDDDDIMDNDF
jgi:phosphopantothenoylcysteine synthetase/decarboxylase